MISVFGCVVSQAQEMAFQRRYQRSKMQEWGNVGTV